VKRNSHKFKIQVIAMSKEKLNTKIRQKQIINVCLEIISERGLDALNVAEIASKLGLATSALYRHYNDKAQMISNILQVINKSVKADFDMAESQGRNAFEKLEMILSFEQDKLNERRAFQMIIFSDSIREHKYSKLHEIRSMVSGFQDALVKIFDEGQRTRIFRNDISSNVLGQMFINLLLANTSMYIIEGDQFKVDEYQTKAWSAFKEMIKQK
jgi:AcrR family transcriptional regulator